MSQPTAWKSNRGAAIVAGLWLLGTVVAIVLVFTGALVRYIHIGPGSQPPAAASPGATITLSPSQPASTPSRGTGASFPAPGSTSRHLKPGHSPGAPAVGSRGPGGSLAGPGSPVPGSRSQPGGRPAPVPVPQPSPSPSTPRPGPSPTVRPAPSSSACVVVIILGVCVGPASVPQVSVSVPVP